MISIIAFEIGAMFLLAALLMYGTLAGFLPRAFHAGKPAGIVILVALVAAAIYYFGPELSSAWRAAIAPAPRLSSSPAPKPVARPSAEAPKRTPRAGAPVAAAPRAKTAPIEDAPAPFEVEHIEATAPAPPLRAPDAAPAPSAAAPDDSPYDSKLKRGIKRAGRFLHLRKKDDR